MAVTQTTQLQFNLDARSSHSNLLATFHKPKPIVIEKFDASATPGPHAPPQTPSQMKFSVLSEDSMSEAVALARRDLKKQKEQEQQERSSRKPSHGAKVPHRRDYRERLQQRESKLGKMLPKENGMKKTRSVTMKASPSQQSVPSQTSMQRKPRPVRSTSGENPYRRPVDPHSQEQRLVEEIKRLRAEMEISMEQVKEAVDFANSEPSRGPPKYAEEIEAEKKRRQRADQHNTRSSRSVYQLQQQVSAVQADIDGRAKAKQSILAALAAAHRGSLRTLQTLVHHLGDFHIKEDGLPRCYRELNLLLHSLHSCCQQSGVVTDTTDNIVQIMQQIQDVSVVEAPDPRRRAKAQSPSRQSLKDSPRRRPTAKTSPRRQTLAASPPPRSQGGSPRQGRRSLVEKQVVSEAPMHHRIAKGKQEAERRRMLHDGVRSLVTAAESPRPPYRKTSATGGPSHRRHPKVPPLKLPSTLRPSSTRSRTSVRKGILMPADVQRTRQHGVHKTVSVGNVHYLEPTVSSMLKEVDPADLPSSRDRSRSPSPGSYRRSRSLTPRGHRRPCMDDSLDLRRSRSLSPYRGERSFSARSLSARSSSRSLVGSPGRNPFDTAAERAMRKQVWMDKQAANKMKEFDRVRRDEKHRLRELKREVDPEGHWVTDAEDRIRARLEPIINRAQMKQNADVLADSILTEVLEDTARHMQEYEDEDALEDHVLSLMDSPTLQQILQRMGAMEKEENQIRRRWATITYEDTMGKRNKFIDAPYSERPLDPEPLLLRPGHSSQRSDPDIQIPGSQSMLYDEGAIMFTKPKPEAVFTAQDLALFPASAAKTIRPKKPEMAKVDLYLSPQMISNIKSHQAKYDKYLKNQSYTRKGKFDPWKIVQEVSDDILDNCISEVSEELLAINDDIVSHVYQTEFEKVPEGTGMNAPVPARQASGILEFSAHYANHKPSGTNVSQSNASSSNNAAASSSSRAVPPIPSPRSGSLAASPRSPRRVPGQARTMMVEQDDEDEDEESEVSYEESVAEESVDKWE